MATTTTNLGLTLPAVSDAADIGVLNTNFQKLDEMCNPALFAPSGYGLGAWGNHKTLADLNNPPGNGVFFYTEDNNAELGTIYAAVIVDGYGTNFHRETLINFYQQPALVYERIKNSSYGYSEWGCINPPMVLGVEYKTAERWNNRPVYTVLLDAGFAVDGKQVTIPNLTAAGSVLRLAATLSNGISLPWQYSYANKYIQVTPNKSSAENKFFVVFDSHADIGSNYTATVQVWYVK